MMMSPTMAPSPDGSHADPAAAPPPWFDARFTEVVERLALFLRLRHGACGAHEIALLHDVYLRARGRAAGFQDRGPGTFLAWLCSIGRSAHVDELRRRGARPEAVAARQTFVGMLNAAADPRTGPLTAAGRVDLRARLAEAIETLEEPERSLLLDRFFGGLSQSQLAEAHGMSVSAVQRALARALAAVGRPLRELSGEVSR